MEEIFAQFKNVMNHFDINNNFHRFSNETYLQRFDNMKQTAVGADLSGYHQFTFSLEHLPKKTVAYKPLNKNMKQISINQLKLGQVHTGFYLPLKIIREPIILTSLMFMAEDINGGVIQVAMYNYQSIYNIQSCKEAANIFPCDKWVIVIEPFYKLYMDNFDGLRSDNPQDVLLFNNENEMKKYIESNQEIPIDIIHKKAKEYMEKKLYDDAIEYYKRALEKDINNSIVNSYLAEAYLHIEYYYQARAYADIALKRDPNNPQILLQKCKALIGLKEYKEAYQFAISEQLKNMKEVDLLKSDLEEKIRNSKGIYRMAEMLKKEQSEYYLNYGDFVNEKVALSHDDGKGVKVIALKFITKGELLSATKALVAIPSSFEQFQSSYEKMKIKLANKIKKTPLDYPTFFELYDGNNKGIDHSTRRASKDTSYDKIIDVIKHNSFLNQRPILESSVRTFGLWVFPAFYNHACLGNAFYFDIGDFLFIMANSDIQPKQEITINYRSFTIPYQVRQYDLNHGWEINCNCELCVYEENQIKNCPEKTQLLSYMSFLEAKIPPPLMSLEYIRKFLEEHKKLFSCYEMGIAYYTYGIVMITKDAALGIDIFNKALRYATNRNPRLERYILYEIAKHYYTTNQNELYNVIKAQIMNNMRIYISQDEVFNEEIILQAMNKKELSSHK